MINKQEMRVRLFSKVNFFNLKIKKCKKRNLTFKQNYKTFKFKLKKNKKRNKNLKMNK